MKKVKIPRKKFSFGTCSFDRTSPNQRSFSSSTRVLNIVIPFEEGLKLNLAIYECLRKLNSYKRSTKAGKSSAMNLAIMLDLNTLSVNENKIP